MKSGNCLAAYVVGAAILLQTRPLCQGRYPAIRPKLFPYSVRIRPFSQSRVGTYEFGWIDIDFQGRDKARRSSVAWKEPVGQSIALSRERQPRVPGRPPGEPIRL